MGKTAAQKGSREAPRGDVALRARFEGRPLERMGESCWRLLADLVVGRASDALPDHYTSANKKVDACECLLGSGLANQIVRYASPGRMSRVIRRGLANAKQLRTDFRAAWFPVDAASSAEAGQRWAFLEQAGLTQEASREGGGEVSSQLKEWLIFSREDERGGRWDSAHEVMEEMAQRQ